MTTIAEAGSGCLRRERKLPVRRCLLLLLIASGAHAGAIYKCTDTHGQIAYQATACPARMRQAVLETREQPLIQTDGPVSAGAPAGATRKSGAPRATRMHPRAHRASRRAAARKQPTSWECHASDGEVFYRHTRCPHSVRGDGMVRSDGEGESGLTHHLKRTRLRNAWDPVPVSARRVSRADACKQINAAAAVDRDGHARDEQVSVYEHDLGRDPCAGL